MMNLILETVVSNAIIVGVLSIVLLLFGRLCKRPAIIHALWVLMLVKLVTPAFFRVPLPEIALNSPQSKEVASVNNVDDVSTAETFEIEPLPYDDVPDTSTYPPLVPLPSDNEVTTPTSEEDDVTIAFAPPLPIENEETTAAELAVPALPPISWSTWITRGLLATWLCGALAWSLLLAVRVWRFNRIVASARDPGFQYDSELRHAAEFVGLKRWPELRLVDASVPPMLWAFGCRAKILMPQALLDRLSPAARQSVLLHELAHYSRRDHWVRVLEAIVTAVYWWHPAVWWARHEVRDREEASCDAWVVTWMKGQSRAYAEALVDTLDFLSERYTPVPSAATGMSDIRSVRKRVTAVMHATTSASLGNAGVIAIAACALLLLPILPSLSGDDEALTAESNVATVAVTPATNFVDDPLEFMNDPRSLTRRVAQMACVAYSPCGRFLATGSGWHNNSTGELVLWDRQKNEVVWSRPYEHGIRQIEFTPDSTQLVAVHVRGAELVDAFSGTTVRFFDSSLKNLDDLDISPDGRLLVTCNDRKNASVIVWDLSTGKKVQTYRGHTANTFSVSFSPDGKNVVSTGLDKSVRLWSVETGKDRKVWENESSAYVSHAKFSHDGSMIAWAPWREPCKVFNARTNKTIELVGHESGMTFIAFSPDDKTIVTATRKPCEIFLWDAATGKKIGQLASPNPNSTADVEDGAEPLLPPHTNAVFTVAFSPDGKQLATASWDRTVKLWDTKTQKYLHTLRYEVADTGEPAELTALAYSPSGKLIAVGDINGQVKVRDPNTGDVRHLLSAHDDAVARTTFSPDERRLISSGYEGSLKIWNVKSGELLQELDTDGSAMLGLAFTADGKQLFTAGDDRKLHRWSVPQSLDGELKLEKTIDAHEGTIQSLAVAVDGSFVVTASADTTLKLWELPSLKLRAECKGHESAVWAVGVSPDSKQVASAGEDNVLRLWSAATGEQQLVSRPVHKEVITTLAYSKNGQAIATGALDNIVRIWNSKTACMTDELRGHKKGVTAVAFAPDNRHLASASEDATAKLWNAYQTPSPMKPVATLDAATGTAVVAMRVTDDQKEMIVVGGDSSPFIRTFDFATGQPKSEFYVGANVTASISPDGRLVAVGTNDLRCVVVDMTNLKKVMDVKLLDKINDVELSPDLKQVAVVSKDRTLQLFNIAAGKLIAKATHLREQRAVAWIGDKVATGCWNDRQWNEPGSLVLWNGRTLEKLKEVTDRELRIHSIAVSPDGEKIATGESGPGILVFDKELNRLGAILRQEPMAPTSTLRFLADSRMLAAGTAIGHIRLFDTETLAEVRRFESFPQQAPKQVWANVLATCQTPDQRFLLFAGRGYDRQQVRAYALREGAELEWRKAKSVPQLHAFRPGPKFVSSASFAPQQPVVALGATTKTVTLWNAETNKVVTKLGGHTASVMTTAFASDGKSLVTGSRDKTVRVWDLQSGKSQVIGTFADTLSKVAVSPDGKTIVAGARDGSCSIFDASTLKKRRDLPKHSSGIGVISFASDSSEFVTITRKYNQEQTTQQAFRWRTATGVKIAQIKDVHKQRSAAVYLPGDKEMMITLWSDMRRRGLNGSLGQPYWSSRQLRCMAMTSDGKRVVTGHAAGQVCVWSSERREKLLELVGHTGAIEDVAISHDDRLVVAVTNDGSVRAWKLK